jgi:hypothetical protein
VSKIVRELLALLWKALKVVLRERLRRLLLRALLYGVAAAVVLTIAVLLFR